MGPQVARTDNTRRLPRTESLAASASVSAGVFSHFPLPLPLFISPVNSRGTIRTYVSRPSRLVEPHLHPTPSAPLVQFLQSPFSSSPLFSSLLLEALSVEYRYWEGVVAGETRPPFPFGFGDDDSPFRIYIKIKVSFSN